MGRDKKTETRRSKASRAAEAAKNNVFRAMTEMSSISTLNAEEQSSYSKLMHSGVIEPFSNIKEEVMESARELNQGRSMLYKNMTEARKLAFGMGVEFIAEQHNRQVIEKMKRADKDDLSVKDLIDANTVARNSVAEGLFDKHAIKEYEERDIIKNTHRNDVIRKIRTQGNRVAREKYGHDFNRMSTDNIRKVLETAKEAGNQELVTLAKTEIGLRGLTKDKMIVDSRCSRHTLSKIINQNLRQVDEFSGIQELRKYKKGMSLTIRLSARYYGAIAQAAFNPVSHAYEQGVKIAGYYQGTDPSVIEQRVQRIREFRGRTNDALSGKTGKRIITNEREKYGSIKNAAYQHTKQGVKFAGNAVADKTQVGKLLREKYRAGRSEARRIWKPFKKVGNVATTAWKKIAGAVVDIKRFIKAQLAKLVLGVTVGLIGLVAVCSIIFVVLNSAILIFDGLDKSTETSMSIAYTKLKDKETKFSNALTSLYMTEKPVGMVGYYEAASGDMVPATIPKYTKSTVEYYSGGYIDEETGEWDMSLRNGQTIKGILAMAAVYIDQDFHKYGHKSFFGPIEMDNTKSLLGSTYKDYVAALYDSTHLIGIEKDDQSKVYYCPDRNEAPSTCNNVIKNIDHGSRIDEIPDNCDSAHCSERVYFETVNAGTDEEGNTITEEVEHIEYTCRATHRRCGGHIDLTADVLISNINYPESEADPVDPDAAGDVDDPVEGESSNDGVSGLNEQDEMKYSMYALDKYATIFDSSENEGSRAEADVNMERDTSSSEGTQEPHTEILDIMNDVISRAGKDAVIDRYVYWAENDPVPWDRNPSYYYMKTDGDINDNELVTAENGTPYRFVSYTSEDSYNPDFIEHGWDKGSREWVQALMVPSWQELYGISDFGFLTGTPLSQEQIEALIGSNPEWADLSDARKMLMALCLTLPEGHPYYKSGQPSGKYAATSQPPMSCAGFVRWLYWSAFDMKSFPGYTESINAELKNNPKWEHYVGAGNMDKLEPGDIIVKRDGGSNPATNQWNHVLIYAGKNAAGQRVYFHESGSTHGYKQMSTYNFPNPNTIQIYKLRGIDQMEIDYGINTSGSMSVNVAEVGEIANIEGDEVWIGWEHNESAGEGARSAGGDKGYAFGMFQFDSRYPDLYEFMQRCVDQNPELYSEFIPWIKKKGQYMLPSGKKPTNNEPKLGSEFNNLWRKLHDKDPEEFRKIQLGSFYDFYMKGFGSSGKGVYYWCQKNGIDLNQFSPVMKGTLWSIAIYVGDKTGLNDGQGKARGACKVIKEGISQGKTEEEILADVYNNAADLKPKYADRWKTTQKDEALAVYRTEYM